MNEKTIDNTNEDAKYIVECDGLVKLYKTSEVEVMALQGLELQIEKGELIAIIGKSGSGKTTLLNIIGALEQPSAGKIYIDGQELSTLSPKQLEDIRKKKIGFVWQKSSQNLFPYMTAVENIESQLYYEKMSKKARREKALSLLEEVGLGICVEVGPEVIAGSSRMKAGTASKMVLNMLTTGAMIKIGKTYENFMIDLMPTNEKLKDRAIRIVSELAGVNSSTALKTLLECGWKVKTAILILKCDMTAEEANELLRKNHGVLRKALATLNFI